MKRTELRRKTPLRATADPALLKSGRSKMPPISRKRAAEARRYAKLRREFLASRPRCEFPGGCVRAATEVHHRKGRVGALFLDVTHWTAICHEHHRWTTEHPAEAIAMGVSEHRVGAA